MNTKKPGRPINTEARRIVLETLQTRATWGFGELWRTIRLRGIAKATYTKIVREMSANGNILKTEGTRQVKTTILQYITKNNQGHKPQSSNDEAYLPSENKGGV